MIIVSLVDAYFMNYWIRLRALAACIFFCIAISKNVVQEDERFVAPLKREVVNIQRASEGLEDLTEEEEEEEEEALLIEPIIEPIIEPANVEE